jgi:tRNA(fMet)-specific endonuclease VapC
LRYLLDTDWIIDHLSGHEEVTAKLKEFAKEGIAASIISVAELYEGVHGSNNYDGSLKALEDFLEGVGIINLDREVCNIFGRERNKLRKTGRIIGDFDLLIASICLRHKLILLTNNKAHFERIDNLEIVIISG